MSLRVLFVEDDAADMELALHQLGKAGMDVTASRVDTPEGLAQSLAKPDFDVIVCDYRLPGWSGLDALAEASRQAPEIPILLLTGDASEDQIMSVRKLGAAELIYKDRLHLLPSAVECAIVSRRTLTCSRLELEATQERFQNIFEQAPTGIAVASPEGRFLQVNPAFSRITGYSVSELLTMGWDELLVPGAGPSNLFRTLSATRDPAPALQADAQFRHQDGSLVDVQWNLSPLRHAEGKPVGHIGQISDITRRKQAEMKLKQYAMVLDRSNQDLQHFAYVASHDLQEPLRMVKSYLELLTRRYGDKLDAEADEFIGFAVDGATRMQNLIQGLLAYSRIGTHGKPMQPVEMDSVFASALGNLEVAVTESSARIVKQPLPCVHGDPAQLSLLFQHLLANSIKFQGGQPPSIEISASRDPQAWRLVVRDNGIGLDPAFSERIFKMFQRLHGPGKYPGSGIGLALCKRIVERHGGRLWVESQPGAGATFIFTIPDGGDSID